MSSTTHNLPFVRFIRQVQTQPMALLATAAAAVQAESLLQSAPWQQSSQENSTFPPRMTSGQLGVPLAPLYDACKYVSDYADGNHLVRAGMVAYRYRVPSAATTGTPANVLSISVEAYVDRWLVDGITVAAYLSDDPSPAADWATLRSGDVALSAQLPMDYTADVPPARIVIEKNATLTLTFPAASAAKAYLYVILSLEDYSTARGFWVEGAALLIGDQAVTTFDTAVAADQADDLWLGEYSIYPPAFAGFGAISQHYSSNLCKDKTPAEAAADRLSLEQAFATIDSLAAERETLGWHPGVRFSASAQDAYIRVIRRIAASWYRPATARVATKLRFRTAAYNAGIMSGRVLVYFVPGYLIPDDGSTRVGYDAVDYSVAATPADRRAFWTGAAATISFWDDARQGVMTKPSVCIFDLIISQPITSEDLFDINQQLSAEGTIISALTPHRPSRVLSGDVSLSPTLDLLEII